MTGAVHGSIDDHLAAPEEPGSSRLATDDDLRAWVEAATGGEIAEWHTISGGNRCRSWAVTLTGAAQGRDKVYLRYQPPRAPSAEPYTVWREARIYAAIRDTDVPAPRLLAVHPEHQAILTELAPGQADYRRITDEGERLAVIEDFIASLAALHALPLTALALPGYRHGMSIKDCVRHELDIWRAMYEEVGRPEPLVAVALDWLYANLPDPAGAPCLVHGDAGPGNFLFDKGRMSALIDWELAHPGDPMEDLAWFSMRAVMEPAPDFPARIADYAAATGAPVDLARIRYHRVFVSTRVVIIRHRNVTGEPGNSIVSRSLNRRLLIEALADATGIALTPPAPLTAPDTETTALFDGILGDLQTEIADRTKDRRIVAAAKNAAKVLKYLREIDRLGDLVRARDMDALTALLGARPATPEAGRDALLAAITAHRFSFETLIRHFADQVAFEAQLAALSSGGLAKRRLPALSHPRTS